MNDDRIYEVYKGEIWSEEAQARARRRIHWMVSEARGGKVLDVGCSQGIASILLAREGFEVIGVDVQPDRIEYARKELEYETEETRTRVRFEVGNAADLDFEDHTFDTVLLGEVIEHLAVPGRVLSEVCRVLTPEGRVVLTTPFGLLHHHDHKQTFYPDDLYNLLGEYFAVTFATIEDRYFRVVAEKGRESDPKVLERLRAAAFATVYDIQQDLHEARRTLNRVTQELEKAQQSLSELKGRADNDRRLIEELRQTNRALEKSLQSERTSLRQTELQAVRVEAQSQRLVADIERARAEYAALKGAFDQSQRDLSAHKRKLQAAEASLRQLRQLERDNARLKHRVAVRDWKLASLRQRRWWQLGSELGKVRRNPLYVFSLPVTVARIVAKKPQRLPRPEAEQPRLPLPATPEVTAVSEPTAPQRFVAPIVPHLPIPVLGALSRDLAHQLSTEVQLFEIDPNGWRRQIEDLKPSYLMVDAPGAVELSTHVDLMDLVEAARGLRIATVLWDVEPSPLSPDDRSAFDVIVGAITRPTAAFAGKLVHRKGFVAPALHNPVEASRAKGVVEVDLVERRVGSTLFDTSSELCTLAKNYQVVKLTSQPVPELISPLVATGTAVVVTDPSAELGIKVADDAEADRMVRALMRSEVLRARLTHPQVREVMRNRSLRADVAAVASTSPEGQAHPLIEVMVATKRPQRIEGLMQTLSRQTYPNLGLVLVPHGIDLDKSWVQDVAAAEGVQLREIVPVNGSVPLGEVFNIGFSATTADVVAKMDDDDFYGDEYLWDLYDALQFSGAEVAGKWAHFVYLEGADSLIYRFKDAEHTFREVVAISTLLMHRKVLEEEQFPAMPYGSGSVFLRALGAKGARVYAADRWNYVYIRDHDGRRNTFPMTDLKLLSNSDVVCKGLNLDHVVV